MSRKALYKCCPFTNYLSPGQREDLFEDSYALLCSAHPVCQPEVSRQLELHLQLHSSVNNKPAQWKYSGNIDLLVRQDPNALTFGAGR